MLTHSHTNTHSFGSREGSRHRETEAVCVWGRECCVLDSKHHLTLHHCPHTQHTQSQLQMQEHSLLGPHTTNVSGSAFITYFNIFTHTQTYTGTHNRHLHMHLLFHTCRYIYIYYTYLAQTFFNNVVTFTRMYTARMLN